jgi:hypothetical protein
MPSQSTGPGFDQDPDEDQDEKVVGQLPDPGEGMTYRLEQGQDGSVTVVLCQDDGGNLTVNSGDNRRQMSDARTRSVLRRMNKANRAYFRDATSQESTLFVFYPGTGRLELRKDPGDDNRWKLILISATTDLIGEAPKGSEDFTDPANEDEDIQRQNGRSDTAMTGALRASSQRKVGDRATANKLRQMNLTNKRFWSGAA